MKVKLPSYPVTKLLLNDSYPISSHYCSTGRSSRCSSLWPGSCQCFPTAQVVFGSLVDDRCSLNRMYKGLCVQPAYCFSHTVLVHERMYRQKVSLQVILSFISSTRPECLMVTLLTVDLLKAAPPVNGQREQLLLPALHDLKPALGPSVDLPPTRPTLGGNFALMRQSWRLRPLFRHA